MPKKTLLAAAAGSVSANSCFLGRRLANGRDGARRCAERARQRPRTHPKKGPSTFVYPGAKSFFGYSRRLPAPFRPSGPSVEPHFSVRCIARRVGRNGAGSGRKRHPLPNSTRITEEIVFSTRCSASLLCAGKCLSPQCRTTLPSHHPTAHIRYRGTVSAAPYRILRTT